MERPSEPVVLAPAEPAPEVPLPAESTPREELASEPVPRELELPSAEPLVFVLEGGATLRGTVLDERGAPLPAAHVSAHVQDGQGGLARCDARGEFELRGLSAGTVLVIASVAGLTSAAELELTLSSGEVRTGVVLQMPACGSIAGTLTDADGAALAGQPVALSRGQESQATTHSDAGGHFEFAGVAAGEYGVRVGMLFGLELAQTIPVRAGETSVVELRAPARSLRLFGRVRIEGELAADVSVTAVRRDTRQQLARVSSDEGGNYAFELPGAGEYWIGVWSERLGANQWTPLTLPSVAAFERDLELRLGQVSGTVWDSDGRRLAGLWVVAEQSSGHELGSGFGRALSDASGDFELLLPTGTCTLRVREAGSADEESALAPAALQEVVVAAGGRIANLDLVLTRGATLEGSVRRKDGSAVFGAKLWIAPTGPPIESSPLGESGRLGRFRIGGVPAGSWWVTASEGESLAEWQRVELESGATRTLEFVLE
jgi:protocatechuate 3,4-dioxygenase beta subunit